MTTSVDVQIAALIAHLDDDYELGPTRCTGEDGYVDCSGYAALGMNAGRRWLHVDEWECWRCDTFQFEAYLDHHPELRLTRDEARRTRGAWAGWNRNGQGHMETSLGDGRTAGARSHALDVGIFPFDGRGWEWYMRPPGLTGFSYPASGNPGPTTVTEGEAMGMVMSRVPRTHVQKKEPWLNRYPTIGAKQDEHDRCNVIGFNGTTLSKGVPYLGMSVRDLGVLHSPITEIEWVDDDPEVDVAKGHWLALGLAGDGGTFRIPVVVHYL